MSPPTIPPPGSPTTEEIARIVISALKGRGYDAGLTDRTNTIYHEDFDITVHWGNISIGSKKKNRAWIQVTQSSQNRKELIFLIYGRRWDTPYSTECLIINLAEPDSFDKIVDFILKISTEDQYKYPFI